MFKYKSYQESASTESMIGLVIESVVGLHEDSDEVTFNAKCGRQFKMLHEQDCCESVVVNDVCGDVGDLVGAKIIHFEERTNSGDRYSDDKPCGYCESFTWTFYDIQTTKGCVNIRWLGESNGYYSESVELLEGVQVES